MLVYVTKFLTMSFLIISMYFVGTQGCSTTKFGSLDNLTCEDFPSAYGCKVKASALTIPKDLVSPDRKPAKPNLDFEYSLSSGKVDILFVVDNSSSMAKEHRKISKQFDSFLAQLQNVDYHIAVITTDISSSPENPVQNAYYQDGKFIPIGQRKYLKNENFGQKINKETIKEFQQAISREETIKCDIRNQPRQKYQRSVFFGNDYNSKTDDIACPSHDERGIYAVNLAIRNSNQQGFFRSDAHLMIVIISDEDIRSSEQYISQPGFEKYEFEDYDYPEVLVESMFNKFGATKSFSVHSIIIIPGDDQCLTQQNRGSYKGLGTGRGFYGKEYARLSRASAPEFRKYGNLLRGRTMSICHSNYGSQLSKVALYGTVKRVPLPCENPQKIRLFVNGKHISNANTEIEKRTLIIHANRSIPIVSDIVLKVSCEQK